MSGRSVSRRAFALFTVLVVVLCAWTTYANVLSDDTALRARSEELARQKAGCGGKCKLVHYAGSRGMTQEEISYTLRWDGAPAPGACTVVVTCRRPYISFGEHECTASKL